MKNLNETPPGVPAGGTMEAAQMDASMPPPLSFEDFQREPDVLSLPPEVQRLLWVASLDKTKLVDCISDIIELDTWRARVGDQLSSELATRAGWAADIARMRLALVPAADRVDLMTKAMGLLQSEPAVSRHGYLRPLVEQSLRLDLERLNLPPNDIFARNLAATLDKSSAIPVQPI